MQLAAIRRIIGKFTAAFNLSIVVLLAIGLVLLYSFSGGFGHSVGEAVVIASLLGAFVDIYLKRRVVREATQDISKFLLGYTLPPEVQGQISNLMQTHLLRRDFDIRYEISHAGEGRCIVKVEASYVVENFTKDPKPYTQTLAFEKGEQAEIEELRLDTKDGKQNYYLRSGDGVIKVQGAGTKAAGPERMIDPKEWGNSYKFGYRYAIEFPSTYPDILSFGHITSGVVVRIIHPSDVNAEAGVDDTCTVSPGRYEYRRVFLPSQHIRIRWEVKTDHS